MQQQTIKDWAEQMTGDPGFHAEDYRIYVIRDPVGETVFYVGQSIAPSRRLLEHLGEGRGQGPSPIGTFILENAPESGAWLFELYTVEECRPVVEQSGQMLPGVDGAELALIHLHRPYFNRDGNPDPRPLPACYKSSYRDRPADDPGARELEQRFLAK